MIYLRWWLNSHGPTTEFGWLLTMLNWAVEDAFRITQHSGFLISVSLFIYWLDCPLKVKSVPIAWSPFLYSFVSDPVSLLPSHSIRLISSSLKSLLPLNTPSHSTLLYSIIPFSCCFSFSFFSCKGGWILVSSPGSDLYPPPPKCCTTENEEMIDSDGNGLP